MKFLLNERDCNAYGIFLLLIFAFVVKNSFSPEAAMATKNNPVLSAQQTIDSKVFQVDTVVVEAPIDYVWSILTNYTDAPKLCPKVTRCKVTQDDGSSKIVAFEVKTFRNLIMLEYSLRVAEHYPERIEFSHYSGALRANEGYWHLQPSEDGRSCTVTYAKFVDGGIIPQCFVTKELKSDMPLILNNVRVTAERKYRTFSDALARATNKIDAANNANLKNFPLIRGEHSMSIEEASLVARKP